MNPLVEAAEARRRALVDDLTAYVQVETPSDDRTALAAGLAWVRAYLDEHLGAPDAESTVDGTPHGDVAVLDWNAVHGGTGRIAVLCHYDTVWPLGTLLD